MQILNIETKAAVYETVVHKGRTESHENQLWYCLTKSTLVKQWKDLDSKLSSPISFLCDLIRTSPFELSGPQFLQV